MGGAPLGARRALSPSSAQVPRTDGHEKGKGNYWTFAGGCESLLDLFENGNFRRRRRRRGPKGEEARGLNVKISQSIKKGHLLWKRQDWRDGRQMGGCQRLGWEQEVTIKGNKN